MLREIHARGATALFASSLGFAMAAPLLAHIPLPRLDALLEWALRQRPARASQEAEEVSTTVLAALDVGRPLVRRGCLTRGLTLYCALRRAGFDVQLAFGMGRVDAGDGFDGHCWLVREGEPYLEVRDPREHYVEMYSLGERSAGARGCEAVDCA